MDVALVLMRDRGERRRFPMTHDVVTIGRGEGCDLRIPLGEVSRKHCSLVRSDDGLVIQDIGSSNGTFVNGKRIREAALRAGDQVRIGSLRFIVQIDGQPPEDDLEAFTTALEQTAPETPTPAEDALASPQQEQQAAPAAQSAAGKRAARKGADAEEELLDLFEEDEEGWP